MTKIVNMHEAKTNLSKLAEAASKGEEVIIAKSGEPFVRLVPVAATPKQKRPLGILNIPLSDEAVAESMRPLNEEELKDWYGE
ncbi:MAG: type II toxin-antitoxin system Phd/YefM family antitoxin [Trueperaceae bacterium]